MTLTNILLSIIALFVFLDWYEHSSLIPKYAVKCRNVKCNTIEKIKSIFKK